jgi:hypothetical protein
MGVLGILDRILEGGVFQQTGGGTISPPPIKSVFNWRDHIVSYGGPAPTIAGPMLRLYKGTYVIVTPKCNFNYGVAYSSPSVERGFNAGSGTLYTGQKQEIASRDGEMAVFGWLG